MLIIMALVTTFMTCPLLWLVYLRTYKPPVFPITNDETNTDEERDIDEERDADEKIPLITPVASTETKV
jgi:hypothetical protein